MLLKPFQSSFQQSVIVYCLQVWFRAFCVDECCAFVLSVLLLHPWCLQRSAEGIRSSGTAAMESYELPRRSWEFSLFPL